MQNLMQDRSPLPPSSFAPHISIHYLSISIYLHISISICISFFSRIDSHISMVQTIFSELFENPSSLPQSDFFFWITLDF